MSSGERSHVERQGSMNRREFLRLGAILAGTSAVAVLTACQAPTPAPTAAPTSAPVPTTAPAAKAPTTAPAAPAPTTAGAAPATPPAAAPTPAPAAAGKPGGKLIALTVADPKSLDIQVSQLAQLRQMADSMYDTLTYQDATDLQVKPRLAKEWKWTNPTTLEMTLTDGVTFHEGQPFTAEDVKFNVDRVVDPNTGSPLSAMLEPIDKTDIVDPMHIRFTLKRPWPALIENFSNIKIYSKTATDESIRTKPNGTGPFKFVEWKQNDYIRLQKNQGYWIKGVPFIDEIDFKPVTEQETRISMMETMAADVMFSLELKDIPRIEASNQLSVQRSTFDDNGDILYINNSREPMSNQKLRLAVSYSIDRETFIKQFLAGYGRKNTSPWDKEHWAYSTEANNNAFPYDLEKAKQLLVDAGFPEGKDSSGKQLTLNIIFPVGYPEWKQGSIMLESALKKLGVASKVEELELNVWADRLISTGDFDLSWDFHGGHVTDPAATLALAFFYPPGPKNICRYTDERLGKLIEQGGSAFDQTERKKLYGEYQQRWNEVQPGYIVGQRVMAHATQNFVKGFVTHPLFFQDLRSVYRDK